MTAPILTARGLSKSFTLHLVGGRVLHSLRDATLDLHEGEFVAVVGRTGAGKSTLVKALLQIYRPSAGQVVYHASGGAALDLTAMGDRALARLLRGEIGYVAQELHVVPRVGALDLLCEAAPDLERPEAEARARALMAALGLPETLEPVFPATFSGGEKRRLGLALVLMRRPRLLVLDEPTSSLDPATRRVIVDLLATEKARGVAILAILHDEAPIAALADRIIEVTDGEAVEVPVPTLQEV